MPAYKHFSKQFVCYTMDASQEARKAFDGALFVVNDDSDLPMLNDLLQSFVNVPVLAFYMPKAIALPDSFKQSKVILHGQEAQGFEYFNAGISKASQDIK